MSSGLGQKLKSHSFANGCELVANGVQMRAQNGERFQIPHPALKKHVGVGHFVELWIDSLRLDYYSCGHLIIAN